MPAKKPSTTPVPAATGTQDDGIRTVAFVSLGCPKNLVDSEKMLGLLAQDGLAVVGADAETGGADAIVINTCGFLEASKEESLGVIQQAIKDKEKGKLKRVIVAGCLVQRHRAKMLEWAPGIDAMVGVFDRDHIVEAVRGAKAERASLAQTSDQPKYWIAGNALVAAKERGLKTTGLTVNGKDGSGIGYFEDDSARLRITPRHYAYLRMSEGCNQNCAFCTIPSIRGKMRSKPLEKIAVEANELVGDGAFEINLIGQDTTSWGDDIGMGMGLGGGEVAGLASRVAGKGKGLDLLTRNPKPGTRYPNGLPAVLQTVSDAFDHAGVDGWVRLMYAYPTNFSDAMIEAMASLNWTTGKGRVLPYIDIPLQHASDRMLSAMRRNVKASQQRELLEKLRDRIPGMAIRTTFISGFPGETEKDHEQLMRFVEDMQFEAMGVFAYSKEDGTVAGTMEDDAKLRVPDQVKERRRDELMALQQKIAFEQSAYIAEQFDEKKPLTTGVRFDVLLDSVTRSKGRKTSGVTDGGALYTGRTYFQAPQIDATTYIQSKKDLSPGELVRCVIVGSDGYDLIARPVEELEKRVGLKILSK